MSPEGTALAPRCAAQHMHMHMHIHAHAHTCACTCVCTHLHPSTLPLQHTSIDINGWSPALINGIIALELNECLEWVRLPLVIATTPALSRMLAPYRRGAATDTQAAEATATATATMATAAVAAAKPDAGKRPGVGKKPARERRAG